MLCTTRLLLPLLLFAIVACAAQQHEEEATTPKAQQVAPPSELALLMRQMAAHADSVKAGLKRGDKDLPAFPQGIKALLTAKPTEGMHIDPITFPTFGKDYQEKVNALYKAAKKDRTMAYNALVQSCANCHSSHCPGPLMRIKKMYAPVE